MIEGSDGIERVGFGGKYLKTVEGFYDLGLHSICNNSLIKFGWFINPIRTQPNTINIYVCLLSTFNLLIKNTIH